MLAIYRINYLIPIDALLEIDRDVQLGRAPGSPGLKGAIFLIGGHKDAAGSDSYNQLLSERRAEAVKIFPVQQFRLLPDKLLAVGFGSNELKNARIVDLAKRMIRLVGLEPGKDIEITFTGVRPGERLNEILFAADEPIADIGIAGIVAARPVSPAFDILRARLAALEQALRRNDREAIYRALQDAVPGSRKETVQ